MMVVKRYPLSPGYFRQLGMEAKALELEARPESMEDHLSQLHPIDSIRMASCNVPPHYLVRWEGYDPTWEGWRLSGYASPPMLPPPPPYHRHPLVPCQAPRRSDRVVGDPCSSGGNAGAAGMGGQPRAAAIGGHDERGGGGDLGTGVASRGASDASTLAIGGRPPTRLCRAEVCVQMRARLCKTVQRLAWARGELVAQKTRRKQLLAGERRALQAEVLEAQRQCDVAVSERRDATGSGATSRG